MGILTNTGVTPYMHYPYILLRLLGVEDIEIDLYDGVVVGAGLEKKCRIY